MSVSGGSKLDKAVSYAKSEKEVFVPLFVIGRKNWLFSASVKGAEASTILYSVAATACANGLNMEDYFTRSFLRPTGTLILPW